MSNYPEVMTKDQVKEYLQLQSDQAIGNACRAGEIPFLKIRGEYRFFKKAIDEYLYKKSMESLSEEDEDEEVIIRGGSFEAYNPKVVRG